MAQVNAREAAGILGITLEQLLTSRRRGLPPGTLGYKVAGRLVFDHDALQADQGHRPADHLTAKELRALLADMGFAAPSRASKAELLDSYHAAVAVGAELPEAIEALEREGEGLEHIVIEGE